ncbi:hypothetical protein B0H16DRAFT_295349 [Mycena metata]|uniref:Uncharacterized protein n=1 Tax=Mycena metata TaxID=1033252 RepID=A0AAD7P1R9_9AGAR|nr:hypothetical protein B0H16DRAFT_295349 [Mycena metata]
MESYPSAFPSAPPSYSPPQGRPPLQAREPSSEINRDADLLVQSFLPSSPVSHQGPSGIPLPFCAPQVGDSFDAPFARGYNTALHHSVGISQDQLLAFIDGLNLAMTSSPPLRVVDLTGMVIGFIPYHWAMIAGAAIRTVAGIGARVLSKTLTDRYLRAANLRLFKPKGLSARLCTTAAMQSLVMRTDSGVGPSTMTKIGRGVGTLFLQVGLPLSSGVVRAIADKPPKVHASITNVGHGQKMPLAVQRRLASLEGYALPLQLDVPPPAKAQGVMDAMGSWALAFDQRRTVKKQDKVEERWRQLEELRRLGTGPDGDALPQIGQVYGGIGGQSGYAQHDREARTVGRHEQKAELKELRRRQKTEQKESRHEASPERKELRRRQKAERKALGREESHERREEKNVRKAAKRALKQEKKLERRVANADLIEHWQSEKGLWLVIMNAELDGEIEGFERADSLINEEYVNPQTWRAEMIREKEVLEEEDSDNDSDSDLEDRAHHGEQPSNSFARSD